MATRTADLFRPAVARTRPGFFATLFQRMALQRQRQRLAELPDHLLKDVGLTREAAGREANRPAWDAPAHFRH